MPEAIPSNARIIEQGAEPFAVVDSRDNHGWLRSVVHLTAAVGLNDVFKLIGNPSNLVPDQTVHGKPESQRCENS